MHKPINPDHVGHKARKRFGQNFLQDISVIERIADAVRPLAGQKLVEIGPGLGALTGTLLQQADHLTVIELDRDLASNLSARLKHPQHLTIIQADAMQFNFAQLCQNGEKLRVVGNLPYNISTPILFHLLTYKQYIKDMYFMLQLEVVERITAQPNTKDYGRLSIMMQYNCQADMLFVVPPHAFSPAPKVTSAVFRLTPHIQKPLTAQNETTFAKLVAYVFNQRRKTLRSILKDRLSAEQWQQIGINSNLRPENLSIANFVSISDSIGYWQD